MPEYRFNVAMDVRAYGTAMAEGDTPEDAAKALTAEIVADRFHPHGGSEDLDYNHPSDIWCEGAFETPEGDDGWVSEFTVPDGPWIIRKTEQCNALTACVVWEAMLHLRGSLPVLDCAFRDRGTCELRQDAVIIACDVDKAWGMLSDTDKDEAGAFDWDFIPGIVRDRYKIEPMALD